MEGDAVRRSLRPSELGKMAAVGDIVIVGTQQLRGVVRFYGPTDFATGDWMGIELFEPVGKNDGSVKGTRYFECKPQHGLFVRPTAVIKETGDAAASPESVPTASVAAVAPSAVVEAGRREEAPRTGEATAPSAPPAPAAEAQRPSQSSVVSAAAASPEKPTARSAASPSDAPGASSPSKRGRSKLGPESISIDDGSDYDSEASEAAARKPRSSLADLDGADWVTLGRNIAAEAAGACSSARGSVGNVRPGESSSPDTTPKAFKPPAPAPKAVAKVPATATVVAIEASVDEQKAKARLHLAEAVEDHDAERIRLALPLAMNLGVAREELEGAHRILNFEVQQSLLKEVEGVRSAVARLARSVEEAEARAGQSKKPHGDAATETARAAPAAEAPAPSRTAAAAAADGWLAQLGERLERRVWEGLERRLEEAITGAVSKATRELLAAATQVQASRELGYQAAMPTGLWGGDDWWQPVPRPSFVDFCGPERLSQRPEAKPEVRFVVDTLIHRACLRLGPVGHFGPPGPSFMEPGAYGPLSLRWRRAAKRILHMRMAASAFSCRGGAFKVEAAVGALEASLAVDDEFEALMARWGSRKTRCSTIHAVGEVRKLQDKVTVVEVSRALPPPPPRRAVPEAPKRQSILLRPDGMLPPASQPLAMPKLAAIPDEPTDEISEDPATAEKPPLKAVPPVKAPEASAMRRRSSIEETRCSVALAMKGASALLERLTAVDEAKSRASLKVEDKVNDAARFARLVAFRGASLRAEVLQKTASPLDDHVMSKALEASSASLDDIKAMRERMEAARAQAEAKIEKATVALQAAERGRQIRKSVKPPAGLGSGGIDGADAAPAAAAAGLGDEAAAAASSAMDDILAAKRRMQAAQAAAEQQVNEVTTKLQAAERGRQARKSVAQQHRMAGVLQRAVRRIHARRRGKSGLDLAGVAALVRRRHQAWSAIFEEACPRGGPRKLLEQGFASALREVHPELAGAQVAALWRGFVDNTDSDNMGLPTFCRIAEAVARGEAAAAEFADISIEVFRELGGQAPNEVELAATRLQAAERGRQARKVKQAEEERRLRLLQPAAKKVQRSWRRWLARRNGSGQADFFSAAAVVRQKWKAWSGIYDEASAGAASPHGIGEAAFSTALQQVHPKLAPRQVRALWSGYLDGTGRLGVDLRGFCSLAQAVAEGDASAAEFADLSAQAFTALAAE